MVPSISSKAIGPIEVGTRKDPTLQAASVVHTDLLLPAIDEAVLLSAYDIHFGFVKNPESFRDEFDKSFYAIPEVLFVDSGWYERNIGPTSGQWYHEVGESILFEEHNYVDLVKSLDPSVEAVLVSWDRDGSYEEQIAGSQDFFGEHPRFSSDILLKPEGKRGYHDFGGLSVSSAASLRAFSVIGVTEKELGDSVLKRLGMLATLRDRLDEADVLAPIHVFGGLDPLITPAYFLAGAEIFDGLSWLRYAYRDGMCIHRDSGPLLDGLLEKRFPISTSRVQLDNLDALRELSRELKVFAFNDYDWTKLRRHDLYRGIYEALESFLGRAYGR